MVVLIAIEGATGDATKDPAWHGTYVHSIYKNWPHRDLARYIAGPDPMVPSTIETTAQLAHVYAVSLFKLHKAKGVFIIGYSLGGASAVKTAHKLEADGIQVDCLALFDGVDPFADAVTVPGNVVTGIHGLRSWNSLSRPYWPKAARFGNIQEFVLKITHWGASGVLLTQGIPPGVSPQDTVTENDPFTGQSYNTACTWGSDLVAAGSLWAIMRANIDAAYINTVIRFNQPDLQKPGNGGSVYKVIAGDSLSIIAGKYLSDVLLWPLIYDANKAKIGPNPNLINIGLTLSIPDINQFTPGELTAARTRGRSS